MPALPALPDRYSIPLRTEGCPGRNADGAKKQNQMRTASHRAYGWASKVRQQQRRTGRIGRVPQTRRGFPSRVSELARGQLRAWVGEQPDRTERELQEMLRVQLRIQVCSSRVGQLLRGMGLRRKKNSARLRA